MKNQPHFILFLILIPLLLLLGACEPTSKKVNDFSWNGKSAAVVLTYDDGLNVHLGNVIPVLNEHKMVGTFYVNTNAEGFKNRKPEWKTVADQGHELGNHTVFHPCAGQSKNRDWVTPEKDLDNYSIAKILAEIATATKELTAIDGKHNRTYAYTCGDRSVLDSSYVFGLKDKFVAARGVSRDFNQVGSLDRFNLNAHSMNGHTAEQMKKLVDKAIKGKYLLVFLFHGVGGEHDLNVEKEAHDELVRYIHKREKDLWVSSLVEVMRFVK